MNFIKLCLQTTQITEHDICLPVMCQTVNFHLAMTRASKLGIIVCTPVRMLANTFQPEELCIPFLCMLLFTCQKS